MSFLPRGAAGRPPQRRMIEEASQHENILCLTYDTFDLRDRFKLSDATWEYHVEQVARLILVGVLAHLVDNEPALDAIEKDSKAHLGVYVHSRHGQAATQGGWKRADLLLHTRS
jgi:isochorismate hydrolase